MTRPPPPPYRLVPYLIAADPRALIDFLCRVFDAEQTMMIQTPDGAVAHAELRVSGMPLMLAGAWPDHGAHPPAGPHRPPVTLHVYVEDCDATMARAVAAGARVERPAADQFYGERTGMFIDPSGHGWSVSHVLETLTPAEVERRAAQMHG